MRIKRVDISGFKSFCEQTRVLFDSPVTSVVGPNGCGKSNIVDAVRWALGEQSAKNLRGKAMEDVIFNGSESRGPQSMAEVTITFNNTDGLSHVDYLNFTEVAVTRRLYRDGTSEYLINKTPCRLRDITDLFLGTGGGARAYSIIEQGRIGIIVSSRSEDRRSMIEEAAGITKYKVARRNAERRMEKTRQNLLRVTDVVAEMERNLASLNRQAKKAERYKRYRAEQTDLELHQATHRYLELRAQTVAIAAALGSREEDQLEAQNTLETLEAQVESLRLEEEAIKGRLDEKKAAGYELSKQIQILENEVKHLREAVERHRLEETAAAEQEDETVRQREQMRDEAVLLAQQQERIERDRASTAERLDELSIQAAAARTRLEDLAVEHDARREGISRARARQAAAESAKSNLERRIEEAETRLGMVREERDSLGRQAADLREQSTTLKEQTTEVEQQLNDARLTEEREQEIFEQLKLKVEGCDAERQQIRDDLQVKTSRKLSLEEVMNGLESHDRSVREAVELFQEEGQNLIDGLLLDDIECPERLERALAAALGDRLQALLVRDRESGLELLEMLKEKDKGRVTVLVRDEVGESEEPEGTIADPRVLGSLYGFLDVRPTAARLVGGLLRDVYVSDDLDRAEELWKECSGAKAFVTLDGQLLEANGAMRGGRPGSVGADLLGQKRQIRELTAEIGVLSARYEELDMRFEALKEDLQVHREASDFAKDEAQAFEITLAEVRKDNARAVEDIERLADRFQVLEREISHQEEMLAQANRDRDTATEEAVKARSEIEEFERLLAEQSSNIEASREEAERLAGLVSDVRVQQAALEQQWENALQRTEQLERSRSEIAETLRRIDEKRKRAYAELDRAAGESVKQKEQLNVLLDELAEVQAVIDGMHQELEHASIRVSEAEQMLKNQRGTVNEIAADISEMKIASRESKLAVEHLLETVAERNDINLLRVAGDYHLRAIPSEEERARAEDLKRLIDRMGPINLAAIDEFAEQSQRHGELVIQRDDLEQALEDLERAISRMDKDSRRRFKETFEDVNRRFREIFPRLFKGGRAELALTDPSDMLHTGVDITAQPPGKRLGNIELMSGGEKALTAVAMLFAIFLHRPSPFCVLDEVDAPLDEANIGRFIDMLQEMTDRSQFIIITHSKLTMERSDSLYGVTMQEPGVSKLVSVRLASADQHAAVNA